MSSGGLTDGGQQVEKLRSEAAPIILLAGAGPNFERLWLLGPSLLAPALAGYPFHPGSALHIENHPTDIRSFLSRLSLIDAATAAKPPRSPEPAIAEP